VKFNLSKILLITFICLAFVGQVMASTAMTYKMTTMQLSAQLDNAQAPSKSTMPAMVNCHHMNTSEATESCCSISCHCVSGSCVNMFILPLHANGVFIITEPSLKIFFSNTLIQNYSPVSLYKPPITS